MLGAVKRQVDRDRSPGQFILTGSVRPRLMQQTWPGTGRLVRVPLTRSSKRYLIDPALAATAAGVAERTVLDDGDLLGRVIDTFCVAQLRPEAALSAGQARLHHLRAEGGRHEVDIVVEYDDARIIGLEFKATTAPTPSDARHLAWLRDRMTDRFAMGVVLHTGPERFELSERIYALPICAMWG